MIHITFKVKIPKFQQGDIIQNWIDFAKTIRGLKGCKNSNIVHNLKAYVLSTLIVKHSTKT